MSFASVSLHAATRPAQDNRNDRQIRQLLENCLKQAEQVDYLTAKVAALEKLDKQGKELIAALDAQIVAQERTITALKAANAAGDKIETISEKELKSYQASLDDAKKEIARWQGKAAFWKRFAGFGIVSVAVIFAALGYLAGSK